MLGESIILHESEVYEDTQRPTPTLGGKSDFQCPKTGQKLTEEGPVFRPFSGGKNRSKDRGLPPVFLAQQPG